MSADDLHHHHNNNNNDNNNTHYNHYIFGYGSLLCPISRAITIPTLKHRVATPCKVKHLQRMWSFPVMECGMTFMGIKHIANAECVGVLVPILNDNELIQLDAREWGYERTRIEHDHVQAIPHLQHHGTYFTSIQNKKHNNNESSSSESSQSQLLLPNVWVYAQTAPAPIQVQCPIAQSYVDIILRGALSISRDFAKDVILSTRGWHAQDDIVLQRFLLQDDSIGDDNNKDETKEEDQKQETATSSTTTSSLSVFWVNDRHDPIYVRADVDYSQMHGHEIDTLLQQHCPKEYSHRRPHYGGKMSMTL